MARWQEVVTLIGRAPNGTNALGDPQYTDTEKDVFANLKDISQTEFYQAKAQGLRPALKFVIRLEEYTGQPQLSHNGDKYDIIRTYRPDYDHIELVCQGIVNE